VLRGIFASLLAIGGLGCASIAGLADYEAGTTGAGGSGTGGNAGGSTGNGGDGGFTVVELPVEWPLQPLLAADADAAFVAQATPGANGAHHIVHVDLGTGAATELVDSEDVALQLVLDGIQLLWVANSGGSETSHQLWQAGIDGSGRTFESASDDQTIGGLSMQGIYSVNGGIGMPASNLYEQQPNTPFDDLPLIVGPTVPGELGLVAATNSNTYFVAESDRSLYRLLSGTPSAVGPKQLTALATDGSGVVWVTGNGELKWRNNNEDTIDVADQLGDVTSLALSSSHIYWTDPGAGMVFRVARDGSAAPVALASGESNPSAALLQGGRLLWVVSSSGGGGVHYIDLAIE
jgi:hypothetical protein